MLRTSSPQHRQRAGTSPTVATPFCQRRLDHGMCRHPVQEWCCPPPTGQQRAGRLKPTARQLEAIGKYFKHLRTEPTGHPSVPMTRYLQTL